jgi:membrane fusion protein, multidrug efflux system
MKVVQTIAIAIFALAILAAVTACKDEKAAEATPIVRPVLSVVVSAQAGRASGFAGIVEPRYQTSLGFHILGRIIRRDASLGDSVRKGARLAALDPVALELAVRSSRASLASSEAQLTNAASTELRQRRLLANDNTSQAQYESAQKALETATASVAQARASLAKAEQQLGYAELHAEFDGVVTSLQAEVGQTVSPGQVVMVVARPDVPEAVVDVPDSLVGVLREGAAFQVALQLDPSIRANGQLREMAPQSDPTTRTRRVRIALDGPPQAFRLGTTIHATLAATTAQLIEVPVASVVEKAGKALVWVVDPATSKVFAREITIAARHDNVVQVSDGLTPGMRVVIAGANSLAAGQLVRVPEESR